MSLKWAKTLRTPRLRFRFRVLIKKKTCSGGGGLPVVDWWWRWWRGGGYFFFFSKRKTCLLKRSRSCSIDKLVLCSHTSRPLTRDSRFTRFTLIYTAKPRNNKFEGINNFHLLLLLAVFCYCQCRKIQKTSNYKRRVNWHDYLR